MSLPNYPSDVENYPISNPFTVGNKQFYWDGEKWKALSNADASLRSQLADPAQSSDIRNIALADEFELVPDGVFLTLRNRTTGQTIARFADGANSSDAHLFNLPLEIRRDSHSVINSVGTLGGSVDQVWRTVGLSDAFYQVFNSTLGNETYQILFDTKPARNDGTKKDGTGAGGLSPADDVYAFDAALSLEGNKPDPELSFPAVDVKFNKKVRLQRRAGGNLYEIAPNATGFTLTNITSGVQIANVSDAEIKLGSVTEVLDNIARETGRYIMSVADSSLSNSGETLSFNLATDSCTTIVEANIVFVNTAGTVMRVYSGKVHGDGSTVTVVTPDVDTTGTEYSVSFAYSAGVLTCDVAYTGGLGVSRVHGELSWVSRRL